MLEASGFDFRTRHPQKPLVKLARHYGLMQQSEISRVAYRISQDLYRTFAPIKQTTSTMAFSCLELAGRLLDQRSEAVESGVDYEYWKTSREEVMGMLRFLYPFLFLFSFFFFFRLLCLFYQLVYLLRIASKTSHRTLEDSKFS